MYAHTHTHMHGIIKYRGLEDEEAASRWPSRSNKWPSGGIRTRVSLNTITDSLLNLRLISRSSRGDRKLLYWAIHRAGVE